MALRPGFRRLRRASTGRSFRGVGPPPEFDRARRIVGRSAHQGLSIESSGDLLLDVIVSEDQTVCDTTMTKFAVGQSAPLTVPNVGDRALFRQQASVAQFVATKGSRCIALAMHGESHLAPIDALHALTVLAGDALQRLWSGPALQYWNEPGDQPAHFPRTHSAAPELHRRRRTTAMS